MKLQVLRYLLANSRQIPGAPAINRKVILASILLILAFSLVCVTYLYPKSQESGIYKYQPKAIGHELLTFPKNSTEEFIFKARGNEVAFKLIGASPSKATIKDNRALYPNAYKNTDVERIASNTSLKQNYILKKPGHPLRFSETLKTSLTTKLHKDGSLGFYEGAAKVATSPRPFLIDAKGKRIDLNYRVQGPGSGGPGDKQTKTIGTQNPEPRTLILTLPSLKGLTYPITLDPTIIIAPYLYEVSTVVDSQSQFTLKFSDYSTEEDDFHFYISEEYGPEIEIYNRFISDAITKIDTNYRYKTINTKNINGAPLSPNTRYEVRARAHNHSDNTYSDYSNKILVYTAANDPINAKGTADYNVTDGYYVNLSWEEKDVFHPARGYMVYYSTNPFNISYFSEKAKENWFFALSYGSWTPLITTPSTNYKHTNLSNNTTYYYKIKAINGVNLETDDQTAASTMVNIYLPPETPPANGVTFQYNIQPDSSYDKTKDGPLGKIFGSNPGRNDWLYVYRNSSEPLAGPRGYFEFDISSYIPPGAKINSAILSLYNRQLAPGNPATLTFTPDQKVIQMYKAACNNYSEYDSNPFQCNNFSSPPLPAETTVEPNINQFGQYSPLGWTNWDIKNIAQDAINVENGVVRLLMKFKVEAGAPEWRFSIYPKEKITANLRPKLIVDFDPLSPVSPVFNTLNADSTTQLSATITDNSVNEDDFHFFMGTNPFPSLDEGAPIASTTKETTGQNYVKNLLGLTPNTKYYIRATAHNHLDNLHSPYSKEQAKYTLAEIPTNLSVSTTQAQGNISISWDANGNPTGTNYELFDNWLGATVYRGPKTSFLHTSTTDTNFHKYKVRAKNGDGVYTEWTNIVAVNVKINPHASYTQNTDLCATCHSSHTAVAGRLLRENANFIADFCFSCHDGSGSNYNVKAAFGNNSRHPIKSASNPSGLLSCSDCHDPHGNKKPDGTYYAKLLRAEDANGVKYYEGNQFCGACHGPNSTLVSGDILTSFNLTPHNLDSKIPDPPSGTKIKCLICHSNSNGDSAEGKAPHGSDNLKLTRLQEENLCYDCHADASYSENGVNIKEKFSAGSTTTAMEQYNSFRHDVNDVFQLVSGGKIECINCHNPHLNNRQDKIADPDNTSVPYTATTLNPQQSPKPYLRYAESQIKDTFITSGSDVNWGSDLSLKVGNSATLGNERTLIELDLSSIPAGSTISKAELSLIYQAQGPAPLTINLYRVTQNWDETTVTWSNAPSYDNTIVSTVTLTPGAGTSYYVFGGQYYYRATWNITSLVSNWKNGSILNNGLMLMSLDAEARAAGEDWSFYSSSKPTLTFSYTSLRVVPILNLEYFDPSANPNVLDMVSYCLKCHDGNTPATVVMPSDILNIAQRYLTTSPHGAGSISYNYKIDLKPPLYPGYPPLACTECHDAHGSNGDYHLSSRNYNYVCSKCHGDTAVSTMMYCGGQASCHDHTTF